MKKSNIIYLALFSILLITSSCGEKYEHIVISTDYGDIEVMLYNSTPVTRDSILSLVDQNYYDDLLFHRIISGFMIQGGDPDSRNAPAGQRLGMGGPGYRIQAEIGSPHFRGAIAMARDGNPQKASSGSQFYLVHGSPVTDQMLDAIQQQKGITYSPAQRELYKEIGGTPQLDNDYTVFGEVVKGIEVVDQIVSVAKDQFDRPQQDVKMTIRRK